MRVFVTGGSGFIGSHLVDRLLAEGHHVTAYDNLASGNIKLISHNKNNSQFNFIEADLLDKTLLRDVSKNHDVIWHLGANTNIRAGHITRDLDIQNCTIATYNMLEAMRENEIQDILFASSATVYGETPFEPLSENYGPLLPISLYGAGKLACEGLIGAYSHLYGIKAWIFRFANVIGARMNRAVIYDFIIKLVKDPSVLEILGDGEQEKPFFLVEECIDGMTWAYNHSKSNCDVYNLGCETSTKITKVADIVCEEMGLKNVKYKFMGGKRGWAGDVPQVKFNIGKMNRLGWNTKHTSDEAVRITAERLINELKLQ